MTPSHEVRQAEELRKAGNLPEAIALLEHAACDTELPDPDVILRLARCLHKADRTAEAARCLLRIVDVTEEFTAWQSAASLLGAIVRTHEPEARRSVNLAVLGSYTIQQHVPMLRLAALRMGVRLNLYEGGYGQYRQEILDPSSGLYAFEPDYVLLALHAGEAQLPTFSSDPDRDLATEIRRWTELWEALATHGSARLIMHNFAIPPEEPLGHLAARQRGARRSMLTQLNAALGAAAGSRVTIVDCDALAALHGKRGWFDHRYWHVAKQAVALEALPLLARHTAAVVMAEQGLSRKCLVLDLDNTLWGGVIGEDGLAGLRLGAGPDGEAFLAFQEYVLALRRRGVILAVCSKNNDADAREPFLGHPDMRIKLDDIAMFVANWQPKTDNLVTIARTLNIGLDALVFLDDNPAEREIVRQMLPEVEVVTLPEDPAGYVRALAEAPWFETASFTAEDARKTEQYRARAQSAELEAGSASLEDFYRSLRMTAVMAPFDELQLPRIVQLIGKTNQFNLTTRRHTMPQVRAIMEDPASVHFYVKLRDRFTDHGLVGLVIARQDGHVLDIDSWLMSCRVIGRTVENATMHRLCLEAQRRGCTELRGTYIPSARNQMVRDVFERCGFTRADESADAEDGHASWRYDVDAQGTIHNEYIRLEDAATEERTHVGA